MIKKLTEKERDLGHAHKNWWVKVEQRLKVQSVWKVCKGVKLNHSNVLMFSVERPYCQYCIEAL